MLRLNTRIGGSDSTPTTAFAGPRRCRFRTEAATRPPDVVLTALRWKGLGPAERRCGKSPKGSHTFRVGLDETVVRSIDVIAKDESGWLAGGTS